MNTDGRAEAQFNVFGASLVLVELNITCHSRLDAAE